MLSVFKTLQPLVLASASPRRQDFLTTLGLEYKVIPAVAPEPLLEASEKPCAFTIRAASQKAREVLQICQTNLKTATPVVIGADTVVALGNEVMGKPQTPAEALEMLSRLAGQVQTVYTGCSVLIPCKNSPPKEICFFGSSQLRMHNFTRNVLAAYVQTGEPMDKAGAYAIQGIGAFLVAEVQGSWTNIVGLPLDELVQVLLENNIIQARSL